MIIHEIPQRSDKWFKIRLGKFTGTDFQTVANGRTDTKKKLMYKKAAEILSGVSCDADYKNLHMERGVEMEAEARTAFELETGLIVREVGFIELNEFVGCSPDGLIDPDSGVELKCKDTHTHVLCLCEGDNSYKWQIQGALYISGRKSWYFVSYNANFPLNKRLYIKEHKPDKDAFLAIEKGLSEMVAGVKDILKKVGNG